MNLAETYLGRKGMEQGLKLLLSNPERNIPMLINLAERLARTEGHKNAVAAVKRVLENEDSNWNKLAKRLLTETHPNVRQRVAINFFVNATFAGINRRQEVSKEIGCSVPWAILMDPTERCNLSCRGCWAGDYERSQELDLELMDRICTEAEEIGIYFIVISGGEPLVVKNRLLKLAEKHPNQLFHIYTNGTLVDEKFVSEIQRLGNIVLAISIDGLEENTNARRGKDVFQKVMHAMDLLREGGCVFGFSATYTKENTEEVASDEFIDLLIEKGATFGWYFTYIPIGKDVDLTYMATPEQRAYMFDRITYFRQTKPIFVVDFWNDGEAVNGCIAGGRQYFHINARGDVEPCAFVHWSTCNIHDISLKEALQNPLFKAYQKNQPFDSNLRRPCPIIDHPEKLREIVKESGAHWTQLTQEESIDEFTHKLEGYAKEWGELAERIWQEKQKERENINKVEEDALIK